MFKTHATESIIIRLDSLAQILLIVGIFCLIFTLAHRAIFDSDIWLHLKTGEYIVQNKTIPVRDVFSFSMPDKPWTDHSWVFQILTYLVYNKWQADGLIFLESLLTAMFFFILFLIGSRTIGSYLEVGTLLVLTAFASITKFSIRPELFSYIFFSLYLYFLWFHINDNIIWLLVPLQILWVNIHGYFFLGPLLILLFIAPDLLRRKALKRLKKLLLFVALACLINPRGFVGAIYPAFVAKEALSGRMQIFLEHVQELQPTLRLGGDLGAFFHMIYYAIIVFCIISMAINIRRIKISDIVIFSFFFLFSLLWRNIIFFLAVCYIIIASNTAHIFKKISANIGKPESFRQKLYFLLRGTATLLFVIWLGFSVADIVKRTYYDFDSKNFKSHISGVDLRNYPAKAVDFILENDIPGHMFNDFNSGSYLIGRSFPKRRVFIDGRTEFYGPLFFKEYMDAVRKDTSAFENIAHKYNITSVLMSMAVIPEPDPLIGYLYGSPEWRLVYFDAAAVIFLKDTPENSGIIKKYKIDFHKYAVPRADFKALRINAIYPTPYIKRAYVLCLFREDELAMLECAEALRVMPGCPEALSLIAKIQKRRQISQ
ncbi:MAG: hypothetical protein ACM3IL_01515 [Deltaproteobacteria bacterium]